jgi:DnaJ-class molecular chaperone
MFLNDWEVVKADNLRKKFSNKNYEKYKCKNCNGTGLKGVHKLNIGGGSSWSGEFCDFCKGVGYLNVQLNLEYKYCDKCNGTGININRQSEKCSFCKGVGIINWLDYIFGVK